MAKIETTAFDSADYLNSAEAIAAYLDAYLEDSTPEELRQCAGDGRALSRQIGPGAAQRRQPSWDLPVIPDLIRDRPGWKSVV